ncbi:MAG: phospholipase [Ignavibacteria bacterium]|nr:phospholipase [Ignavibacteria bacterium]
MEVEEHHISVFRTARYFKLGKATEHSKDIWIMLHGHRQLAGNFIKHFEELAVNSSVLYAPEALMRIYLKGDYGDVGASWMTKEDRESDIKDYVNYLDRLFFDLIYPEAEQFKLKINVLGFSQGSATLCRWLSLGKARVNKAVFWCGSLAHEINYKNYPHLKEVEIHQIFASNDPYYNNNFPKSQIKLLNDAGIISRSYIFNGGHEISVRLMKESSIL